jgi:protein-L-isoaspartate(D-aspartate) O-methyltransferase
MRSAFRVARALSWAVLLAMLSLLQYSCDQGWVELREDMVREQVAERGIGDPAVLAAMRTVPRHLFVDEAFAHQAYQDTAVPIGHGQSTPQPYIVALMTELLEVQEGDRILEIGTGSGYQAAILTAMGAEVFTIEIRPQLCERAQATLRQLGFSTVRVRCGDGYGGWPEQAPFDGILVTAADEHIPEPLWDQLRIGGQLVIPIGDSVYKDLKVMTRTEDGFEERSVLPVSFGGLDRQPGDGG